METGLYLIPTTLGDFNTVEKVLPDYNVQVTHNIKIFIVEQVRTARRFLKRIKHPIEIDNMTFLELNKHTDYSKITNYLNPIENGESIGLLSEAGTPCIADPGAVIVKLAHEKSIKVFPLIGPNSIILSLMASGFNGQNFSFHGYLPVEKSQRVKSLQKLESFCSVNNQTQIFIETPYRNNAMLASIIKNCKKQTMLCVASNISLDNQYIKSLSISQWGKEKVDLDKKPTIFLLSTGD
ncbi:MAG: SAM-dependent methyltransferase [Marinilabiliales bacterium]|nr:MAG: SAM-dependent methyltransferase [Marinilabiliales bacterium]